MSAPNHAGYAEPASANAPPRVLLVGSAVGGGGAENRFRLLLENLFGGTAEGVTLHATNTDPAASGQKLHSLGWRRKANYPAAAMRLRRLLTQGGFDVALSMGLYPNVVLWAASRGLRRRPALVMTEITRPYTESTQFSSPLTRLVRQPLYRFSYGAADLVATNSEDGLEELVAHYGVRRDRIRRLPNLIDAARVRGLAGAPAALGCPRFCMVARFDPIKRIDTLLRAVHALEPGMSWHLDLVGDGAERQAIQALVAELGLQRRVTLHGWLANPFPVMAAAVATVLCSEYEGFSNTVLESMVLGTPVVTSLCSLDARRMVGDGAALGFDIGDWSALSDHLATLLTRPALTEALRLAASRHASRHHADVAIAEYETIARDAVVRRGQGRP